MVGAIVVFLMFGIIFYVPLPKQFESHGIFFTDEILLIVLSVLFNFFIGKSHRIWKYAGLMITLWAFTIPLLRMWETAESTWNIVLGLLPWADAEGYYLDAVSVINGGLLSTFSGRRPLFASLLAVLLKITGQNLQLVIVVFVLLNGVVVFFFALEVYRQFGAISAAMTVYLSQFFYRPYLGTTLTEQLGFPAGLLALTILIRSIRQHNHRLFAWGLMFLTFSLLVRAGTLFIIPFLFLFGIFFFTRMGFSKFQTVIVFIVSLLIPLVLNIYLGKVLASENAIQFGNFSYTLYGQAIGGKRWTQVMEDHPELNALREPELSREIYRLAFEEIANNPFGLVAGSIKAWKDFVCPGYGSLFSFLDVGNEKVNLVIQFVLTLLFLIGLWLLWQCRKDLINGFILVLLLGVFLSVPFLPPIDAGIRPYAATIAVVFLPVFFAVSRVSRNWVVGRFIDGLQIPAWEIGFGVGLLCISVFGGVSLKLISRPMEVQAMSCPSNLVPLNFRVSPGSYLYLVTNDLGSRTHVPVVQLKHVFRSFDDFPYGDFAGVMRKIGKPALVTLTINKITKNQIWVIAPPELSSRAGETVTACARPVSEPYQVMYVESYGNQ